MLKTAFFTILILVSFEASAQVVGPSQNPEEMVSQLKTSKHDTLRIKTLQSLLQYYTQKRGYLKVNLDSALNYGQQAKSLSDSLHRTDLKDLTLIWIGEAYLKFLDYEKGKAAYLEAVNDYHAIGDSKKEVRALLILAAKAKFYKLTRPELLDFSKRALAIANRSGDPQGIMNGNMITGALYKDLGFPDSAATHLLKALPIAKAIGGEDAFKVYMALSAYYRTQGDNAKALTNALAALNDLKARHVTEKSIQYAHLSEVIAEIYEAYDSKQSRKYYNESMNYALINKNEGGMEQFYGSLRGLSNVMCDEGDQKKALALADKYIHQYPPISNQEQALVASIYARCYEALHENQKAEKNYLKVVELYKDNPNYLPDAKAALARFYSGTKQFKKSAAFLQKPLNSSLPFMNKVLEEYQRFQLDSANGDYASALKHFRRYKELNDTVFNVAKAGQIDRLTIQYQTKEKEQSIKLLKSESLNQQARLQTQRADLQRINLQKNITLGGIAVLILVSGLVVYSYMQKRRSNEVLTAQKAEINKKNEILEKLNVTQKNLLSEKDWLLKEVHHRVKNNLQIVMSLLSSQSAYLENSAAIEAIRESQNRVQAISLIHQKLYKSSNVASINMPSYVADLLNYLADSFDTRKRHIQFEQVIESFNLDLAQAVPIGLILNESITNAIKYAFDEKGGQILVALQLIKDETLLLTIADNGKGFPAGYSIKGASTLGMEMMKALSKQLCGDLKVENKSGVRLSIEFQIEKILADLPDRNLDTI